MRGAESQPAGDDRLQAAAARDASRPARRRAQVGTEITRGPRGAPAHRAQIQRVRRWAHLELVPRAPWATVALHSPARSPRPVILSCAVTVTRRSSFAAETAEWRQSRLHLHACPCLRPRLRPAPRRRRLGVHPGEPRIQMLAPLVSAFAPKCRGRPGQAEFPQHPPSRARRRGASTNRRTGPRARPRARTVSRCC